MHRVSSDVWNNCIFVHLDGRDGARLLQVSKEMHILVKKSKGLMYKIYIHYMWLDSVKFFPEFLPSSLCNYEFTELERLEKLRRNGYAGENVKELSNGEESIMFNDFYDLRYFNWTDLAFYLREKNLEFFMVEYPPLQGRERFYLHAHPSLSIHRGSSIIVKRTNKYKRRRVEIK